MAAAYEGMTPAQRDKALLEASTSGNLEAVDSLLAAGANKEAKDAYGQTPLHKAAMNGHTAIVERLLAAGANKEAKDAYGQTPLHKAAINGHTAIVERLLAAGANKEAESVNRQTPLFVAAMRGHIAIVERLLAAGANKEAANVNRQTPLFVASWNSHIAIVDRLLAAGANKEAKDAYGLTPLHLAVRGGHTMIVDRLLDAGANKEATTVNGLTPLLVAAMSGHIAIVERLLAAGANKEAADVNGLTPLLTASLEGHTAIVERLLAAGADIQKRSNAGKTAKDLAREKGHLAIVQLIESNETERPKWKGFSRSDIETLNSIFQTEGLAPRAINVSCCPVCFKVVSGRVQPQEVERLSGCRYMTHNCSTSGGHYHAELYKKYKNEGGNISWCTICGRICTGHRHHKLQLAQGPKADLLPSADPFGGEDACEADGGGGLLEKLARYRRMREFALQLQKQINKISFVDAVDKLIVETWNAPLFENLDLPNIATTKTWNIPSERFMEIRNEIRNNASASAPDAPQWPFHGRPDMMPIVTPAAEGNMNAITMNDLAVAIQLKHRTADGESVTHDKISIHTLFSNEAFGVVAAAGTPTFGNCFFEGCSAILYPGELQYILDTYNHPESLSVEQRAEYQGKINAYKQRFNEAYRDNAEFKARVDTDVAAAAAMPAGGAGGAGAGQGGGKHRRTRRHRHANGRRTRRNSK